MENVINKIIEELESLQRAHSSRAENCRREHLTSIEKVSALEDAIAIAKRIGDEARKDGV